MLVITIFLLYFLAFVCALAGGYYLIYGTPNEVIVMNAPIVWAITDLIGVVAIAFAGVLLALAEVLKKIYRDDKTPL